MAHQASLRPGIASARGPEASPGQPEGIIGNLAEFGEDVFTLAELQGKLAARDLNDCIGRAILPLIFGSVAAVVALGTVPVALLGAADVVAQNWEIGVGKARLVTAAVAVAVAGLALAVSLRRFGSSLQVFRRSGEELTRNLAWARTVLVHSGRPARNRKA